MTKNKLHNTGILVISFICLAYLAQAQVQISGPECILAGTEYQYNFYGKWQKGTAIDICIEGGTFPKSKGGCISVKDINSVRITWSEGIAKGKISVSSSGSSGSLTVTATRNLQGGVIDATLKSQQKKVNELPGQINCSVAIGGSCKPAYSYQWEQSDDNFHWTEIPDATNQNLSFPKNPTNTVFVRRKVTDKSSGSIAYSDSAIVVVENISEKN